jgi:hypothetical protein
VSQREFEQIDPRFDQVAGIDPPARAPGDQYPRLQILHFSSSVIYLDGNVPLTRSQM